MARSTNGPASKARRKRVLKQAKGFWGLRSRSPKMAKNTIERGLCYAYRDRKVKKRVFRSLWIQRINAGARMLGTTYGRLMCALKEKGIVLNRKVLADLAMHEFSAFQSVVEQVGLVRV